MQTRNWGAIYLGVCMTVLVVLAGVGLMRPWFTLDTASWTALCHGIDCFAGQRFPLYARIFRVLTLGGHAPWLLPWLQDFAFLGAGYALARAAGAAGLSRTGVLALALALPASNMLLIWGRAEMPEILGRAALLAALAAAVRAALGPRRRWPGAVAAVAAGLFGAVAYCLDPAQLPFIFVLPALILWLGATPGGFWTCLRPAGAAAAAASLPFLLIAGFRLATLGSFNIVSFGGYGMSGMAASVISPTAVPRLPPALRGTARELIARRRALVQAGIVLPVPRNSSGQRSLFSETLGYFDILGRSYDEVTAGAVIPLRGPRESWVAFDARLQRLDFAVVRAQPIEYLAWVAAAAARMTGRMLVLNLPFALATLAAFVLALLRPPRPAHPLPVLDVRLLCGLTGAYSLGSGALACLVTFPAQRYIDGTGLLISAWPIYAALRLAGRDAMPGG